MNSDLARRIKDLSISTKESILSALKQMDTIDRKLLLVFDGSSFLNILSIGDIQRAIIMNLPLNTHIDQILRKNTIIANENSTYSFIKNTMKEFRIECMPVINENKELTNLYFWDEVFGTDIKRIKPNLNLPVIIMAGGKSSRLKPISNVIPKPLMPIGEKTIIEEIMDRFVEFGCNSFLISINYKAETIRHYFNQLQNDNYHIDYFQEEKPLGTAGSLFLLKNRITSTFFISNCDIIIKEDYSEILKYHKTSRNELTIVSVLKHYSIPYGTINTGPNGVLIDLNEKPELTFKINSGMYVLEPQLLQEIPDNQFFHITDLIDKVKDRGGKIGVFPVSAKSWIDIGNWEGYLKIVRDS